MNRYPDSWEYSKDKGWIRPKPDKAEPEDPKPKKSKARARKKEGSSSNRALQS
jgi:hypothetical protein